MIDLDKYYQYLTDKGRNLGELRKNQADMIENANFQNDIGFRRVYILDLKNGWHYEDAKFSRHRVVSLSNDNTDSYLQFRPKVHYPIGTYVFIPDDKSYDLDINYEDPLYSGAKNLWFIVERNDDRQFVRYYVIQCDWLYKWVVDLGKSRKIAKCWGSSYAANSYTSGIWNDYYINSLDNLSSAYLPNTYYTYGQEGIENYGLDDVRTIKIGTRFMITTNALDPKLWMTTKIGQMNPQGVLQLSIKQDDYNSRTDSVENMVADYYTDSGDVQIEPEKSEEVEASTEGKIQYHTMTEEGYLEDAEMLTSINIAKPYYFKATNDDDEPFVAVWRVQFDGHEDNDAIDQYAHLTKVDDNTVMLKLSRARKLIGETVILSVSDDHDNYKASIKLEVV